MTNDSETGVNPHWKSSEDISAHRFRDRVHNDERQNQNEHEELRLRVDRLERDMAKQEPVIEAASKMVVASRMVKATIIILAVILSMLTGAIQVFDRWVQK